MSRIGGPRPSPKAAAANISVGGPSELSNARETREPRTPPRSPPPKADEPLQPCASAVIERLAASSASLCQAVDKILTGSPGPLRTHLESFLSSAEPVDIAHAPDPRRAKDALRLAAVLTWLVDHVDEHGALSLDALRKAAGPGAEPLVGALLEASARKPPARPNFSFLADTVQVLGMTVGKEKGLRTVNAFLRSDTLLPRQVPALEAVKQKVAKDRFAKEGLVAAQHLLPSSLALYEALIDRGMDPTKIHVLGTPYASNPLVVATLRLMGVDAWPGRDRNFASGPTFEKQRVDEIHRFLLERADKLEADRPEDGYLVLDDGGLLQLAASGDRLPQTMPEDMKEAWSARLGSLFPPETHAVEQTTRGITELEKRGARFATVSVAKCEGKRREGVVIGLALADSLELAMAQRGMAGSQSIALVSAGTVGLETARILRDAKHRLILVDKDPEKLALAKAENFEVRSRLREAVAQKPDVAYSCTGKTAVSGEEVGDFEGMLISGSSMAVELDDRQLGTFRTRPLDVANRGRPANFDGTGYENLSPAQIGITRALLFSALAQKVDRTKPGLVGIDPDLEATAVSAWEDSGGHLVELERPDPDGFSGRPDAIGGATRARHDEWIAYLSGLRRAVCPRPTEQARARMTYFFHDGKGVRMVDTGGEGRSVGVALPSVPEAVHLSSLDPKAPLFVECRKKRGGKLELFEVRPGEPPQLVAHGKIERLVSSFVVEDREHPLGPATRQWAGHAYLAFGRLLVRKPGASTLKKIALPEGLDPKTTSFRWIAEDVLGAFDRKRGLIHPIVIEDTKDARSVAARLGLPSQIATIEAEAVYNDPSLLVHPVVVLGRDASGKPLAAVASPVGAAEPIYLPEGAIFRGLGPKRGALPGVFEVEYTLPGDPVEREHFRTLAVDAFAGLRTEDVASSSLAGRLREALTT